MGLLTLCDGFFGPFNACRQYEEEEFNFLRQVIDCIINGTDLTLSQKETIDKSQMGRSLTKMSVMEAEKLARCHAQGYSEGCDPWPYMQAWWVLGHREFVRIVSVMRSSRWQLRDRSYKSRARTRFR